MSASDPPSEPLRILHLEDSLIDAELIHTALTTEWPECRIEQVKTRAELVAALTQTEFQLLLSDFSMPGFNGLAALMLAREHRPELPFIFLSGTMGEDHAVEALKHGATDYVIKDRMGRLVPAVRRALDQVREQRHRQRAERRLREQAGLLNQARDAICVTDLENRLTYLNGSAERLFGWTQEEMLGRPLAQLLARAGSSPPFEAARLALDTDGAWTGELRVVARSGRELIVDSRWTLVRDDAGRPQSILLINTDITEQKKLELQLLRSQRLESIGTLAGGIAHDLNNALAPILMSVDLLRDKFSDARTASLLDVLDASAQHGASLVRQVLAFARGAEGERTELQPGLIIRDVVQLISETFPRAITIRTEVPAGLWLVRGDPTQLSQVVINLCVNARDAMSAGGELVLRAQNFPVDEALIRAHPGASAGPHVLLTIADTGCGIAAEILDRVFDHFFTTKQAGKGTGLGLSTVLGLVKSHGGFLQVQSVVGCGTEFRLFFPAVKTPPPAGAAGARVAPPRGRGETVLVIDDEPGVREVAQVLLKAAGYHTLVAANGPDGLALYRQHAAGIAAVITDLMMPVMQGAEVIAGLRTINPAVRVLAMSGLVEADHVGVTPEPGRLEFLAKPMTGDQLVRALQHLLAATPP